LFSDNTTIHVDLEKKDLFVLNNKNTCRPISFSVGLENGTLLYSDLDFGNDHSNILESLIQKYETLAFTIKDDLNTETFVIYRKVSKGIF